MSPSARRSSSLAIATESNESPHVAVASASAPSQIRVAVIIPTYKQPLLLEEALECALRQENAPPYAIVLVNDGCPLQETHRVAQLYAQTYPDHIHYLRKGNGGLSAARNTGIDYALQLFPALEAVYFLDSDNRLQPYALNQYYRHLMRASASVGWAYPNIHKFGIPSYCDTSAPYSALEHRVRNISEAGSMVHRRMLDAGVRFDENMKLGYEDWEFWLQGQEKGFGGLHVPNSGFLYRYRPESMVSGSIRHHAKIMDYIFQKHASLFSPQELLRREAEEAPRYGVWITDTDTALRFTDEDKPISGNHAAFLRSLLEEAAQPCYGKNPGYIMMLPNAVWERLRQLPVSLSAVFWQMEILAAQHLAACLTLESDNQDGSVAMRTIHRLPCDTKDELPLSQAHAIMISTRQLWRSIALLESNPSSNLTTNALITPHCPLSLGQATIGVSALQGAPLPAADLARELVKLLTDWKREECALNVAALRAVQTDIHRTRVATPFDYFNPAYQVTSCFPAVSKPGQQAFAIALPAVRSGLLPGLIPLAEACRAQGWDAHIFLIGKERVRLELPDNHPYARIHLLTERLLPSGKLPKEVPSYFGAPPLARFPLEQSWTLATFLAFAAVINIDVPQLDDVAGALRKSGARVAHLTLDNEVSEATLSRLSAYEPAYQRITVMTPDAIAQLQALGIAESRLQLFSTCADAKEQDNAPGWRDLLHWITGDL